MNDAKSILATLQEMAEKPGGVDAHVWLTGALKLRVLLQVEQEKLVEMEREVQKMKASILEGSDGKINATAAKIKVESSDLFMETKKQEVMIKTALDIVLLAKKFATTEADIYKAG